MITHQGYYIDGSWTLTVEGNFDQNPVKIAVKSDTHIGGVMHKIQEAVVEKRDWSDYALWWPQRKMWLLHTRTTLDQYGVQSDDILRFIPRHYIARILLPSLQTVEVSINFSSSVFSLVNRICRELGIRYPEELSLQLPLDKNKLKANFALPLRKRDFVNANLQQPSSVTDEQDSDPRTALKSPNSAYGTMTRTLHPGGQLTLPRQTLMNGESMGSGMNHAKSVNSVDSDNFILSIYAQSQNRPLAKALEEELLWHCKEPLQKARLNSTWLDTSRSLMEQDVDPSIHPLLYLRYKFSVFYDLNLKYDAVRLNQLYEHARWTLLTEIQQCTEHDAILFAALQTQIKLQTAPVNSTKDGDDMLDFHQPPFLGRTFSDTPSPSKFATQTSYEDVDEVDIMLTNLEKLCMGSDVIDAPPRETKEIPKLKTNIRVCRENKLGMKTFQPYLCVIQDLKLSLRKHESGAAMMEYDLLKNQTWPTVSLQSNKYFIQLRINPSSEDTKSASVVIRFDSKEDYANNLAALHLTSEGKTLASTAAFEKEKADILEKINLQTACQQPLLTAEQQSDLLKNIRDYIPEQILKSTKSKDSLKSRIAEAHTNLRNLDAMEAKLKYIQAWQRLPNFGFTYFLVQFDNRPRKPDLIAINPEGFMILKKDGREVVSTWHFREMRSWNINWDLEKIVLEFRGDNRQSFTPLTTNCKTLVEFIGGYIFLSQRTTDKNQELDLKLYHRLTCASA